MVEATTKKIIIIIVCLLVLVVMVWVFLTLRGFGVDVRDIFFPGRKTIFRYYACSLAICTKGSDWLEEEGHRICLDNDTVTRECNLWCHDLCVDEFGDCPKGECCGPKYYLNLSLDTKVDFWGNYEKYLWGTGALSKIYLYKTDIYDIDDKLHKNEDLPPLVEREGFPSSEVILGGDWYRFITYETMGFVPPTVITVYHGGVGFLYDDTDTHKDEAIGMGDIFLDKIESREKFGCYETTVPGVDRDSGFYTCKFVGDLKMWTEKMGDERGDVWINTTVPTDYWFNIDCTSPIKEGRCYQKITPGNTAEYTIRIDNHLRTGAKFQLTREWSPDTLPDPNCKFLKDGNEIVELEVDDGDSQDFILSCEPTVTESYEIYITADVPGYFPETTSVFLDMVDYSFWVDPESLDPIPWDRTKKLWAHIKNELGDTADFTLSVSTEATDGGTLKCTFLNGKTTYGLTLDDTEQGMAEISCEGGSGTSEDVGEYRITITASDGEIPKTEIRTLELQECVGEVEIVLPSGVKSGNSFDLKITGVEGCSGKTVYFAATYPELVLTQCSGTNWNDDGSECSVEVTANTPGSYTFYALLDIDGLDTDEDGNPYESGEISDSNIEITVDAPAYIGDAENEDRCEFDNGAVCGFLRDQWAGMCDICANGLFTHVENCKSCVDPQTCREADGFQSSASNICCVYDKDYYSNGPESDVDGKSSVPCFTTDTETWDQNLKSEDFWFWGYIDNPRNILTQYHSYTYLEWEDCGSVEDCYGGSDAPSALQDLSSQNLECTSGHCSVETTNGIPNVYQYNSWIFIRISPESRPVYGVYGSPNFGDCPGSSLRIFLHKKTGEWIYAGTIMDNNFIRPSGWAWTNIDSMLIGLWGGIHSCTHLYYVGLLTRGEDDPFCLDRPDNVDSDYDYYRIVDDGKTCYWGVDCPYWSPDYNDGWKAYGGKSTGVGPLKENECSCSGGNCGRGWCEKTVGDNRFCYYEVACANGGWRNGLLDERKMEKCDSGEQCRSSLEGCVAV